MKKLYSLLLVSFLVSSIWGQITAPHITNYTQKDYGALKSPEVWSVTQGDDGKMYFGFINEIGVFDGVNWEFISIPNALNVSSIANYNGKIYFGAYAKFGVLNIDKDGHLVPEILSDKSSASFANIWRIEAQNGVVYFQAHENMFAYDGNNLTDIKPDPSFHLSFSCGDDVYVRMRENGLMKVEGTDLKLVNTDPVVRDYGIFGAFELDNNQAFIITEELGLLKTNADLTAPFEGLRSDSCRYLFNTGVIGGVALDRDVYAFYSTTTGCYLVNRKGDLLGNLSTRSGLASDEIKDAFVDANGKLWLATGNGVSKIEVLEPFEFIGEKFGINGNVQCLEVFNDKKYVGTSLGLMVEDSLNLLRFNKTAIKQQVWSVVAAGNQMFVATNSGLYISNDGEKFELLYAGNYNDLYYDNLNMILICATETGVMILDQFGAWKPMSSYLFGGGNKTNITFDQKNNCYWVGSSSGGLLKIVFDGFDFNYKMYGTKEGEGLRIGEQIVPFNINGTSIFGTPYDLLEFTNEEEAIEELKKAGSWNDTMINHPEFYPGSFFESQEFFIGSSRNYQYYLQNGDLVLAVIDNEIGFFEDEKTFDITKFSSVELGRVNFLQIEEDGMYIGGSSGLCKVDLLNLLNSDSVLRKVNVNITGININDSLMIGTYDLTQVIEIPFYRNKIHFDYASTTIHNSSKPVYSWRLVGDDDNWSDWTEITFIDLKNLHEGDYRFEVRAMDIYGNVSEVSSFSFTILKPWYRTIWAYLAYIILFIVIVYLAIVLGRKRLKAQNERLEEIVEERTEEITIKNKELEHSYHEIAEQKQEITDSINYAQRIQQAILPLSENIGQHIDEYFVLFQPKDIVSGDFYWFAHTEGRSIFVCADCTGHGVPGAFMSMIGSDKLNQAVLEGHLTNPADILSSVNKGIKKSLKQKEDEEGSSRDGMDVTVVSIDSKAMQLQMAGAHNSLIMIREGELFEYKATKVAVAGFTPENQVYDLNEFDLQKGDCLYMTTDGYPDQFGGPKGKKLKSAVFKRVLLDIYTKPMEEQKSFLKNYMEEWMGDHEQIDDICVIGIRI